MKKRLRAIQIFLVLIPLLTYLFSAYLNCHDLMDFDFPSHEKSFENSDQVDLLISQRDEHKLFTSGVFPIAVRAGIHLLKQFSYFTCQPPSSDQEIIILRC